jgi:hypothetical protein
MAPHRLRCIAPLTYGLLLTIMACGDLIIMSETVSIASEPPKTPHAGVTCILIGDKDRLPHQGSKLFLSASGVLRDIGSHAINDDALGRILSREEFLTQDRVMNLILVIAEEDNVPFDIVTKTLARIKKKADPRVRTVVSVSFKTLTINP